jgi:UPF0755 protein
VNARRAPDSPKPAPRRRTTKKRASALPLVLFAALSLGALAVLAGVYLVTPHAGRGVAVRVMIPERVEAGALASLLAQSHVIDRPRVFELALRVTGVHERVKAGMIPLRDDLTPRAVLRALGHGGGMARVTIPEGYTRFDVARRLESAGVCAAASFLARTESPEVLARAGIATTGVGPSAEGYLFPDTYDLPLGSTADAVIDRMTALFARRFEALKAAHPDGVARASSLAGADPAEVDRVIVTLASIIERETGAPEDRPHVASVFWNRLTRPDFTPRLLQSDPTVVYGCLAAPRFGLALNLSCGDPDAGARMPITTAMLDDARNPWNTYRHEALPPTPVCNPGARALESALAPAASEDLYFVARGDGRSVFAATLDEHRRNVRAYLRAAPRAP